MGRVFVSASMSLDGFIAQPDGMSGPLFDWYAAGDVVVDTHAPEGAGGDHFDLTPSSAEVVRRRMDAVGAIVVGRNQFDVAGGWVGGHLLGVPVLVVTHRVPDGWPRGAGRVAARGHPGPRLRDRRRRDGDRPCPGSRRRW